MIPRCRFSGTRRKLEKVPKKPPWHIIGKRALGLCAPDFLCEAPSCSPPHATGRKRATAPRASRGESLRAFRDMKAFASFFKSKEDALLDRIFELKFTAKQLSRTAAKCEKEERQLKAKVKVAIEKGNLDGAKIHATDAIRKKNEQLNMLKLSSRLDGVVSRLETQAKMNMVNKNMAGIVKSLDQSLKDMNLEAVSNNMDQFERQFENLDVQTEFVEQAMSNTTAATTPADEVTNLMQAVADEHGLAFASELPEANKDALPELPQATKEDDLSDRLAALKSRG